MCLASSASMKIDFCFSFRLQAIHLGTYIVVCVCVRVFLFYCVLSSFCLTVNVQLTQKMWWLNWAIASKGHIQVPYNGKRLNCYGFGTEKNEEIISLSLFRSVCRSPRARACVYRCFRTCVDCLQGSIFLCASIGSLSSYLQCLLLSPYFPVRLFHAPFINEVGRECGTWIGPNYTGCSSGVIGFELRNGTHAATQLICFSLPYAWLLLHYFPLLLLRQYLPETLFSTVPDVSIRWNRQFPI